MVDTILAMQVFVIKEYIFREKYRDLKAFFSLSFLMDLHHDMAAHPLKTTDTKPEGYGHERIISAGRTDSVQLILDSLPALTELTLDLLHGKIMGPFYGFCRKHDYRKGSLHFFDILVRIFFVTFLCVVS